MPVTWSTRWPRRTGGSRYDPAWKVARYGIRKRGRILGWGTGWKVCKTSERCRDGGETPSGGWTSPAEIPMRILWAQRLAVEAVEVRAVAAAKKIPNTILKSTQTIRGRKIHVRQ